MNTSRKDGRPALPAGAFTAIELLVVIAMVALGALLLVPALARTRTNSPALQCLNNVKQMAMAWAMYSDDNSGQLVYNRQGGSVGKSPGNEGWVGGWLDFTTSTDNTNSALLVNHSKYPYAAFLGPYIKTPSSFKCPADLSTAVTAGGPQPRVRSISMNCYLGTGSSTWTVPSKYTLCTKATQITSPANMFVVLDERADSINDGVYTTNPDVLYELIDYPACYHDGAASFAFADGHSEMHKWLDPRTMPVLQYGQGLPLNVSFPGDKDVLWIGQHSAGVAVYP
jgi:prepilin-type processing-associated H-X9-DG protein